MARSFFILLTEPIVALSLTVYMSCHYGLAHAFFEALLLVITDTCGMPTRVSGLPFIALIIVGILGSVYALGVATNVSPELKGKIRPRNGADQDQSV